MMNDELGRRIEKKIQIRIRNRTSLVSELFSHQRRRVDISLTISLKNFLNFRGLVGLTRAER